jgi:hypothetical protein
MNIFETNYYFNDAEDLRNYKCYPISKKMKKKKKKMWNMKILFSFFHIVSLCEMQDNLVVKTHGMVKVHLMPETILSVLILHEVNS